MFLRVLVMVSLLLSAVGLGGLVLRMLAPEEPVRVAEAVPAPAAPPPPPRARVLVAARAMPPGTLLKEGDLTVQELAPEAVPPGAALEDARLEMQGGLLRRFLEAGESLPRDEVLRPRDRGFLAAVLRPGRRAISVGVDVVTGAAGLIWPGDQVDLILTQELAAGDAPLGRRVIGETVLVDVRVIAVDQQFTQGASGTDPTVPRIARTVTLEVSSDQAERVAVASRLGRIALTVRAIEPPQDVMPIGNPVFSADVSPALNAGMVSRGARMQVIQGGEKQEVLFR
ncbi:Flp pilus assembly protein CpaB [Roseomonas sp. SSH11]|uniref:Flp pilus assembly protein CpaB n=1 Tax=Pararoseomonas baculiformis TaxID=2820812 RepID=A0ABS4AE62_9PROT|nr:Flp pilus assembly protein CpaB [Pararoseomonas baculiformis]MBP0445290.1 Flp pilus assembly protein CpaB [Pararoseomonas baculiformis]